MMVKRVVATLYTCGALFAAAALLSQPAYAVSVAFSCVTANNAASCSVAESQFLLEVVDAGPDKVAFILSNEGPAKSAVARIYFEDARGLLAGPPEIHQDSPGVIFQVGVSPPKFPGGASLAPAFDTSPVLGVMAANPDRERGLNPGEHIGLVYPLSAGSSFGDVLADLSVGNLRIGLRVFAVSSDDNESFVSQPLVTETLE